MSILDLMGAPSFILTFIELRQLNTCLNERYKLMKENKKLTKELFEATSTTSTTTTTTTSTSAANTSAPKRRRLNSARVWLSLSWPIAPTASMRKSDPVDTKTETAVPAFSAEPKSEAVSLALSLTGANRASGVSYATEAGLFQDAGCPAVVCGPGDIEQAHTADEFVTVSQIESCLVFLAKLTERIRS